MENRKMNNFGKKCILGLLAALGLVAIIALPAGFSAGFAQLENVRAGEAIPGATFLVSFEVHNTLNDRLKYVLVKAPASENFVPVGGDTWASPGEVERNERISGSLLFKADEDLVAGVYSIPVTITSESKPLSGATFSGNVVTTLQTLSTTEYVTVEIQGAPFVVITQKSSVPGIIPSGKEVQLTFDVYNNGTDTARNTIVAFGEPEGVDLGSASREIFVGEIAPKTRASIQIVFSADRLPERTFVDFPVEVTFDGGRFTAMERVYFEKSAELDLIEGGISLERGKNEQTFGFSVKNAGNRVAENIRLSLITDYPLTPSGRNAFIKKLEPGEEAFATFTVDVDSKSAVQSYPVQVAASYEEEGRTKGDSLEASVNVTAGIPKAYFWLGGLAVVAAIVLSVKLAKKREKEGLKKGKTGG